jgi:MSHA biogenesis protein MshO
MNPRQAGFSLIELVVALMLSTIVVGFVATIITVPAQAHFAQARRSELAAEAEAVTQAMSQDFHRALPNSVRTGAVGGRAIVEMIGFSSVEMYRDAGIEGDPLIVDPVLPADDQFDVLGFPAVVTTDVVINNLGIPGQNAYELANVIAPATMATNNATITLTSPGFRFAAHSPRRRAFLTSAANAVIRYECDPGAGTLRRYDNLAVTGALGALPGGAPSRLITRDVSTCTFTPRPGNAEHGGLLIIEVSLSRVTNGTAETLRVMKQLKVEEAA